MRREERQWSHLLFSRASLSGRVVLAVGTGGTALVVFDSSAISAFVEEAQLTPEITSLETATENGLIFC